MVNMVVKGQAIRNDALPPYDARSGDLACLALD